MSIFPVHLSKWFRKEDEDPNEPSDCEFVKVIVKHSKCEMCGREDVRWRDAWGYHAICYGFDEVWCTKRCLKEWRAA